ncbi:MAG: hypothetical protein ACPLYW_01375 [Candidatus Nanoarchaeia archaeon]
MLKIPISKIIEKIREESGLPESEIKEKIQAKISELKGLVSEEGAAFIVASELGINLLNQPQSKTWKISDLVPGMGLVDVEGYVDRTFRIIPYTKGNEAKEVGSFLLRDESGEIRVVLWDDKVNLLKEGKIKGKIKIKYAQVKQNAAGMNELHAGNRTIISFLDSSAECLIPKKTISDLALGQKAEILAEIVKIFPPKWFPICPTCGKKAVLAPEGFVCPIHKVIDPQKRLLISFYLDDGTGVIRASAFGKNAELLWSCTGIECKPDLEILENLQHALLGKTILAKGTVRKSKISDRLEFAIFEIQPNPNPKDIIVELMSKLNGQIKQNE